MDAETPWQALDHGIYRIDANYGAPGVACFYLLREGSELAVIETGTSHSVPALLQLLEQLGLGPQQVRYVIPTHVHLDHAGGAGSMMREFPEATLVAHPRGAPHLSEPGRLVESSIAVYGEAAFTRLYGSVTPVAAQRIRETSDGDSLQLGSRQLLIRHTPGHADHHLCLWDAASAGWFSGDVLGVCYEALRLPGGPLLVPTTTPTQFRPEALVESIRLLQSYAPAQAYLTHFGQVALDDTLLDSLAGEVAAYRDIALALADSDNRQQALHDAIESRLLQGLDGRADDAVMTALAGDFRLNAQGLDVWLARGAPMRLD